MITAIAPAFLNFNFNINSIFFFFFLLCNLVFFLVIKNISFFFFFTSICFSVVHPLKAETIAIAPVRLALLGFLYFFFLPVKKKKKKERINFFFFCYLIQDPNSSVTFPMNSTNPIILPSSMGNLFPAKEGVSKCRVVPFPKIT